MYPHLMSVLLDCVHENLWCLIKKRVGEGFKYMWILCQNKQSPQKKKTTTDMMKPLFRVNDDGSREEGAYINLEPGA